MEHTQIPTSKPSAFISAWRRWRGHMPSEPPCFAVAANQVSVLNSATAYRETLLQLIKTAQQRIFIAALYVQDDEAGREILDALYAAKAAQPTLEIAVFVDWHRAQRGLIGKAKTNGNAALYQAMAKRLGAGVNIYGVPVQRREFMGVMHLKGLIIDDKVLYSGASLNNVYLQRFERYRIDRYHLIAHRPLADSMVLLLSQALRAHPAVQALDCENPPKTTELASAIIRLRRSLMKTNYAQTSARAQDLLGAGEISITPLLGLGIRGNLLNQTILELLAQAKERIVLFTPYFNLPGPVRRALDAQMAKNCRVSIVLGDKTANDFYIPPNEPFKTIGALPYLYEVNLFRFCKARQKSIDAGLLNVHLWQHENNSFHLKGLLVDDDYALLTGNNINPRAWRLDLENGLLLHDPQHLLTQQHEAELAQILQHSERLTESSALDLMANYPPQVQRLIKRLARMRADRLINQVL